MPFFAGGPAWQMSVGNDIEELVHAGTWPTYQERLNVTWRSENAFAFDGFAKVYGSGCTAGEGSAGPFGCSNRKPSAKRLLLVFPNVSAGETVGLADGGPDESCVVTGCPLYFPIAASRARTLQAGREEVFVTVFIPIDAEDDPATIAGGVRSTITDARAHVWMRLPVQGRSESTVEVAASFQLRGAKKESGWTVQRGRGS